MVAQLIHVDRIRTRVRSIHVPLQSYIRKQKGREAIIAEFVNAVKPADNRPVLVVFGDGDFRPVRGTYAVITACPQLPASRPHLPLDHGAAV